MRMLVVGHGSGHPASALRTQLVDSLRFLGHEVVNSKVTGDSETDRSRLAAALDRYRPDVLINVPSSSSLDGATVRELTSDTETVAVCLHRGPSCSASPTDLDSLSDDLRHYDLVTVPDRETFDSYAAEGTFRLSLLAPAVHIPALDGVVAAERRGVVVVGDADPCNVDVVAQLDGLDDVVVVGRGWDDLPLDINVVSLDDDDERQSALAAAQLMVELPASLAHQSSTRRHWSELAITDPVLEAAAVGTPSVVLDRPAVTEVFRPSIDVLTCESPDDLVSLVPLLLSSPDDLALIGDAAWQTISSSHTWAQRWDALLAPWVDPHEIDEGEDVRRVLATSDRSGETLPVESR